MPKKPMNDQRFALLCRVRTADNEPIYFDRQYYTIEADGIKPITFTRYYTSVKRQLLKVTFHNNDIRNFWYKDLYANLDFAKEQIKKAL